MKCYNIAKTNWFANDGVRVKLIPQALFAIALVLAANSPAQAGRLQVVAAENFYGDVARQIGGDRVEVASIINNPDQDPHLFELTPSIIRHVAGAQIVIFNGANYDPWMNNLIAAAPRPGRAVLNVAQLTGKKPPDNPHLWYAPEVMQVVAGALSETFGKIDPVHAADYAARQETFDRSLKEIDKKVDRIRAKFAGTPVTATEPLLGYMASALDLQMRNQRFQLAVMNNTEPSASDTAAFEQDLKEHKVKVLLFSRQAATNLSRRMLEIAHRVKIPVVGLTETEPAGATYQSWMLAQLDDLQKALADTAP
jgi:zinc/manganese transport system substrate-binding protein